MPRNIWTAFKASEREFQNAEKSLSENSPEIPENGKNAECKILKEIQRTERMEFFAQGKSEFSELRNSIYRKVREGASAGPIFMKYAAMAPIRNLWQPPR